MIYKDLIIRKFKTWDNKSLLLKMTREKVYRVYLNEVEVFNSLNYDEVSNFYNKELFKLEY